MAQIWATPPPGFRLVPGNKMSRNVSLEEGSHRPWCPACRQDSGFIGESMGYQDRGAQDFYAKHWKAGGYDGGCKMFEGDMIKSHKSRWGMTKCTTCGCLFWHNWDQGYDKGGKYHAIVYWMKPKGMVGLNAYWKQ